MPAEMTAMSWIKADRPPLPLSLKLGAGLIAAHVALAALGPLAVPFGPTEMGTGMPLSGASLSHPFGIDQLGRDVFSRAVHGAALVLTLAISGTLLGFLFGALLGLVSGYRGGTFDAVVMRLCEVLISIPVLVLALLLVALAGVQATGALVLIIAVIGFVYAPRIARIARAAAMEVAQREYIAAARLRGDGAARIALREILPNVSGILLVEFALRAAYAPVLVASLGFLGFGLKPPTPEWGLIIAENRGLIFLSPATVLGPGLLLASLVIGVNLLTEGIARVIGRAVPRAS
jgi:peptide/nickel transport system permease protein